MKLYGLRSGLAVSAVAVLASGLAACGQKTREAIGLDRPPPDEFAVLTRAPLAIPPGFGLRPPQPGMPRPQEREARDRARLPETPAHVPTAPDRHPNGPGLQARSAQRIEQVARKGSPP